MEGLTTAAGLWTAAAIGMASGAGEFVLAVAGTVAVLAVLFGLRVIDDPVARRLSHAPHTSPARFRINGAFRPLARW